MHLKSVEISQYKNLKDFKLTFDKKNFVDVFVGKNGTGKSNLFEALIEIFRHLSNYGKDTPALGFNYTISYEIRGTEKRISFSDSQLFINGRKRKSIGNTLFPDNILIYYSGHNKAVSSLLRKCEEAFRKQIREADFSKSRRFIGIGPEYKELLLSLLLIQPNNNKARRYICRKLGIKTIGTDVTVVLRRPSFADGRLNQLETKSIDNFDSRTYYWGALGVTKDFLEKLVFCVKGEFSHSDLYSPKEDSYQIPVNIALFQKAFSDDGITDIFRKFDNLKILEMLDELSISTKLENGIDATVAHFSDGQFQSVYIYSVAEIFKDVNCITLLDEPDSFLHPKWQLDFLKQISDITETASRTNHILMSSHSATTLCSLQEQKINLFEIKESNVSCTKKSKREVIGNLSNNFIQYSEDESKLLIDNVIRNSNRPILFVEGPSDVSILNTAYARLYPDIDTPILVQDAFERGFIRSLLSRYEIFKTYPEKLFFGLFDFDDGYDDWRKMKGKVVVKDIGSGLCKKLKDKNAYAFLLPIPDNQLRLQVWDEFDPLEKIKPNRSFYIEHVFWDVLELKHYFKQDKREPEKVIFKGDKIKFAQKTVPKLEASCFEVFRPMFEFIQSKCSS